MSFSSRTPDDLSNNPIAKAQDRMGGSSLLDLTESNPTRCGFDYPSNLLEPLGKALALTYEPKPFGHPAARQAVARYLSSRGPQVEASQIILTASTSEAYSYLFKLLGNPGDPFLVPVPGYPLLEHLLRLEGLEACPYPLRKEPGWPLDRDKIQRSLTPEVKGLITVDPHNPTGCFLSPADKSFLMDLCLKHSIAYLSDEVFSDFNYSGQGRGERISSEILSFRMGGLSKSLGLPQLKLSWMVLEGPRGKVEECRERLELIADTYLSVNTPVQLALEELLSFAPRFQEQVLNRVLSNRSYLEQCLRTIAKVKVWPSQGGWYALVELLAPKISEERLVIELLEKEGVLVQPGGFYDFPAGCFLVLSLMPSAAVFEEGTRRLRKVLRD